MLGFSLRRKRQAWRLWLVVGTVLSLVAAGSALLQPWVPAPQRTALACTTGIGCTPIKHIVFIIKENRSFDSMFGTFPGANGATTYSRGGTILPLNHEPDSLSGDIDHTPVGFVMAADHGNMDQFYKQFGAMQTRRGCS